MEKTQPSYLQKQAWDYFSVHASQRLTIFNFYIVSSSVIATSFFASFKSDSNLESARPALAALLCFIAFIFWKLDQRNKFLIKNSEQTLKYFEGLEGVDVVAKIFTREELETKSKRLKGWRKALIWRHQLSYSDCFNFVFLVFFAVGIVGFFLSLWPRPRQHPISGLNPFC